VLCQRSPGRSANAVYAVTIATCLRISQVTATSELTCMKLDRATFSSLLGSMNEILERDMMRREREAAKAQRPKLLMDDLEPMTILGVGTFGRVKLVVHRPTNTPYALKCMRKGQVIALKQVEHVMNEKKLLEMCDHPFLLNLAATYQDPDEIYMLLDGVWGACKIPACRPLLQSHACRINERSLAGGELFSVLRERNKFDEPTSRFYAGCVASAFSYMHDLQVVYRDLKPENLLFDAAGYLKASPATFHMWLSAPLCVSCASMLVRAIAHSSGEQRADVLVCSCARVLVCSCARSLLLVPLACLHAGDRYHALSPYDRLLARWSISDSRNKSQIARGPSAARPSISPPRSSRTKGTIGPWTGGHSASSFSRCLSASPLSAPTTLWISIRKF
jgi:hypothetical protein